MATSAGSRRTALVAAVLVLLGAVALEGVRRWGPVNPDVRLRVEEWPAAAGAEATTTAIVWVENRSGSPVDVSAVDAEPAAEAPVRAAPRVGTVTAARVEGEGGAAVPGPEKVLPVPVAPHDRLRLTVRLDHTVPWCPGDTPAPVAPPALSVRLTSVVGRSRTLEQVRPAGGSVPSCTVRLASGSGPEDPVAARAAIEAAFATVYSGPPDVARKRAVVQDSADLDAVMRQTAEGPLAAMAALLKVKITQLSFDRPDHVSVVYELTFAGHTASTQRGEAVLVEGRWKLTRATVCQDLALVKNPCP